jgi:hypothetical protein
MVFTPPTVTFVVCMRLAPDRHPVPSASFVGLKLVSYGVTRNFLLLVSLPFGVVTVTKPELAPLL